MGIDCGRVVELPVSQWDFWRLVSSPPLWVFLDGCSWIIIITPYCVYCRGMNTTCCPTRNCKAAPITFWLQFALYCLPNLHTILRIIIMTMIVISNARAHTISLHCWINLLVKGKNLWLTAKLYLCVYQYIIGIKNITNLPFLKPHNGQLLW